MIINRFLSKWLSTCILKLLNNEQKHQFRKIEKTSLKLLETKAHRQFNITCQNKNLLPNYTNIKLHDNATRAQSFVSDFRMKIVQNEITKQSSEISNLSVTLQNLNKDLKDQLKSELKQGALNILLDRILKCREMTLQIKHSNKLARMYGGPIYLKQPKDSVLNLSSVPIDENTKNIFNLGMNCHLRTKYSTIRKQIEIEKLYSQIETGKSNKNLSITNEDSLMCELKRFGLKECKNYTSDILTKDQHEIVKELRTNEKIVIRKADKNNNFVILNRASYKNKLDTIINDDAKFKKLRSDTTDALKRKLNDLIDIANSSCGKRILPKLIGHYQPGYLYGNPKIHKNSTDPPLRPIISQIGTPTYEIAKLLNNMLSKYIPTGYMIQSTDELMNILKTTTARGTLASLDVENLFTNVPVKETIDIIINNSYNHSTLNPPVIPKATLKLLLETCTTETPFRHIDGSVFVQVDGVSMGSPLGPMFANFYMANLEKKVFEELSLNLKPPVYCRYVDDIFIIIDDNKKLNTIKQYFESNSVLKFTYEIQQANTLAFLDVKISNADDQIKTQVHTKPTDSGECINYIGLAPQQYKTGVIKTMLHRAYLISSDWETFHLEIQRLKQLFTNNNFPMKIIEEEIAAFLNRKMRPIQPENENTTNNIKLYYRSQMSSQYKQEESNMKKILKEHITPKPDSKLKISIYYKNRKLSNLLIQNKVVKDDSGSHVVYKYVCGECEPPMYYVGYTTTTLKQRALAHTQNGSIKTHNKETHNKKIITSDVIPHMKAIFKSPLKIELQIAEAIFIKKEKPPLNNQQEGDTRILKIF